MKRFLLFILLFFYLFKIWSQAVDINQLDLTKIDTKLLDLSVAKMSHLNYRWFYIEDIKYDNNRYNAFLEYDYKGNFTIKAIDLYSYISPVPLDFNKVELKVTEDKKVYITSGTDSLVLSIEGKNSLRIKAGIYNPPTEEPIEVATYEKLVAGFFQASDQLGDWVVSTTQLNQTNKKQLYAKYIMELEQKHAEIVYEFKARVDDPGWVGYGLHFLVKEQKTATGYGLGQSYLLWFTRDEEHNKTDRTFVELYRSFDDIHMIRLASQMIQESITEELNIELYFNYNLNLITVIVNNDIELSFFDSDKVIKDGEKVAFRTLGASVSFYDFSVKVR